MYNVIMNKIPVRERISYGFGSMAYNIANASLATFILPFYQTFGVEMYRNIFIIITISKVFDAITDIPVGLLIDKTNTKWGKSRPYQLLLAIPFAIIISAVFFKPNPDSSVLAYIYIIITFNLFLLLYTGVFLSHSTLNMQITDDSKQRLYLNIFRVLGGFIITIIINSVTYPLVNNAGVGWWVTWTSYGIIGAVFFIICFLGTKERVTAPNNYTLKNLTGAITKNYVISLISYTILTMKRLLLVVPAVFFCGSWFGNPALVGLFTAAFMMPMMAALCFAPAFFRFEKARLIIYTNIIYIVSYAVILAFGILTNNIPLPLMLAVLVINGITMAPHEVLGFPLFMDVIEENFIKKNTRIEGPIYSGSAILRKIAEGTVFYLTGVLTLTYVTNDVAKSRPILLLFVLIPIIISLINIIALKFYRNEYELKNLKKI